MAGACSLAAPWRCAACRSVLERQRDSGWGSHLCSPCFKLLRVLSEACRGCGQGLGPFAVESRRCSSCRRHPQGRVRTTTALLRYHRSGRALLTRLKYNGLTAVGEPLGRDLALRFREREPRAAGHPHLLVVPIPLHPWRRWSRGFNQAEEIARGVAAELGRPLVHGLRRLRPTRALFEVDNEARADILAGAFRATPHVHARRIALVDDIRTSGSTIREAARVLREAGALRVDALVVGR